MTNSPEADDRQRDSLGLVGIGTAARLSGATESTLRYWEQCGLLQPADRRSRWRLYGADELHRIGLIRMWRETGLMSIEEIERILSAHNETWRDAVDQRLAAIELQQQRLSAAKAHLEHLLTCTDDDPAQNCPYLREMTADRMPPS